jgi:hypothetical protein
VETEYVATSDDESENHHAPDLQFAIVCLLARGVRGQRGVEWLIKTLIHDPRIRLLVRLTAILAPDDPVAASTKLIRSCEALVLRYDLDTLLEEEAVPSWGSHQEGLHRLFSGRYFLQAVASPAGASNLIQLAVELQPILADIASGRPIDVAAMIRPA